jgi:hypothetical protein
VLSGFISQQYLLVGTTGFYQKKYGKRTSSSFTAPDLTGPAGKQLSEAGLITVKRRYIAAFLTSLHPSPAAAAWRVQGFAAGQD